MGVGQWPTGDAARRLSSGNCPRTARIPRSSRSGTLLCRPPASLGNLGQLGFFGVEVGSALRWRSDVPPTGKCRSRARRLETLACQLPHGGAVRGVGRFSPQGPLAHRVDPNRRMRNEHADVDVMRAPLECVEIIGSLPIPRSALIGNGAGDVSSTPSISLINALRSCGRQGGSHATHWPTTRW